MSVPPSFAGLARPARIYVLATLALAPAVLAGSAVSYGKDRVLDDPVLLVVLVAAFVALDHARIDLFDRGNFSPASVPVLALAFIFGPLGPALAEGLSALIRCARRVPPVQWSFDLALLSMAGAGAALTFDQLSPTRPLAVIGGAVAGAVVYYVINIPLLSVMLALNERTSAVGVFRERLAWLWPQYVGIGFTAGAFLVMREPFGTWAILFFAAPLLLLWVTERQYVDRSRESVEALREQRDDLRRTNAQLQALLGENQELMVSMQRSYLSTITSLARTIEAKDPYTGGHTERVGDLAYAIASEVGLSEEDLRAVEVGAIIHDIGKIGVPDQVLTKPGRLTEEEFAVMRKHPEISSYIVSELDLPPIVKHMVRNHHERYDGQGYPDRLSGENIPLAARILAVADTVDAMTSDRPYRAALPLATAVAELRKLSGQQFCPVVVEAFLRLLEREPTIAGLFRGADDAGVVVRLTA